MIDVAFVRDRIRLLREIDRGLQLFGAATHRYQLAPPFDDRDLAAVEARLGVELPGDYRRFVRELGATGAGPYHGLVPPTAPDDVDDRQSSSARAFPFTAAVAHDAAVAPGAHRYDGTVVLAEHGRGDRSLLVVKGARRGEVWSDVSHGLAPEAPGFLVWYGRWIDRALVEWLDREAPRIAVDGPETPAELEAIAVGFEAVTAVAETSAQHRRTLGYLHLRERRIDDALAMFAAAAAAGREGTLENQARLHLDRARAHLVKDDQIHAIAEVNEALAADGVWSATRDDLRAVLERALLAAGRGDEALAVLDQRAAERESSVDLHHRLARERLARNDVGGAGLALERAAQMAHILGRPAPLEARVPRVFEPIIGELRGAGRGVDADALVALVDRILGGN